MLIGWPSCSGTSGIVKARGMIPAAGNRKSRGKQRDNQSGSMDVREPDRKDQRPRESSQVDRFLGKTGSRPAEDTKDLGFAADAASSPRMMDFVLKSGDRVGLPYAYLLKVYLSGGAKLELSFTDCTVTITGRNLGLLYQHLLAQTVRRIEESLTGFDDEHNKSFVESISMVVGR
jgi:hypothetical protein